MEKLYPSYYYLHCGCTSQVELLLLLAQRYKTFVVALLLGVYMQMRMVAYSTI